MITKWIEHKLKVVFINFFRHFLICCPLKFVYFVACFSSAVTYRISGEKVCDMRKELKRLFAEALPDVQATKIIKDCINHNRKDLFETWKLPSIKPDEIKKMCYFEGKEYLDEAVKKGKGAILLVAHFGSRKFVLSVLGYEGYKINQVAAKPVSWKIEGKYGLAHKKIMDVEFECEKTLPAKFIYIDESLKPIFKVLKHNELVVIAIDGPIGTKRVAVKLLNCSANFSPTAIAIGLKTESPVIPTFVIRQKDNRHRIVFEKPLPFSTGGNLKEEVIAEEAVKYFAKILERYVSESPCQYLDWMYRARLWPINDDFYIFQ